MDYNYIFINGFVYTLGGFIVGFIVGAAVVAYLEDSFKKKKMSGKF